MGDDDESVVQEGFWLSQAGRQKRHSDGAGGEAPMLAVMLHDLGWIDVGISESTAVVRLNPGAVGAEIARALPRELEESAAGRRVELVLCDQDANPVTIAFPDAASACAHLDTVLRRRGQTGTIAEDGPDRGETASIWGPEAFPIPLPFDLSDSLRYPIASPLRHDGENGNHVDEERFARSLTMAEWLAPLNTADSLRDRRLVESTPEMVSFALRSLGWIAVKRSWKLHGRSLRQTVPEVVALDPAAVRQESLTQLIALCTEWSRLPGEVTFAWWDGVAWVREKGLPGDLADRLRALCRIAANDEPMSLVDSVEVPIHSLLASGTRWNADHPFAVTLKRWQDERANAGRDDGILRDLERLGLFQRRTKLLIVDDNDEIRIARYASGRVRVWDEWEEQAMHGSRLLDVPDRGLGQRVQRDLQAVQRRGEPVVHRCTGVVFASAGPRMAQWSRLTVPIFASTGGGGRISALLSTCDVELVALI